MWGGDARSAVMNSTVGGHGVSPALSPIGQNLETVRPSAPGLCNHQVSETITAWLMDLPGVWSNTLPYP